MDQLRSEFSQAIFEAIRECHDFGYHPIKWEAMNREQHPVEASIQLVQSPDFQDGFRRLLGENREHLTVESIMLRPEFAPLFSEQLLKAARWRLQTANR
ncbi:hypothetical protein [Pseudomonas gingeri]